MMLAKYGGFRPWETPAQYAARCSEIDRVKEQLQKGATLQLVERLEALVVRDDDCFTDAFPDVLANEPPCTSHVQENHTSSTSTTFRTKYNL